MEEKTRVLFVCTGNICRSPTAEVVFNALVKKRGLDYRIEASSAGIQAFHVGEGADSRSSLHAKRRGYDLSGHRVRVFQTSDHDEFDWILCMDRSHLQFVQDSMQDRQRANVELFLKRIGHGPALDMPDPYYGGDAGFETVLDLCEQAGATLLDTILAQELEESSRRG